VTAVFGTHDLVLFVVAGLLLNVTPGADTLYIVGRGAAQGRRAGVLAALGVGAGCCVHMVAAALGLSAILAASATAFTVVKLAGAAYLVWLGICLLRSSLRDAAAAAAPAPQAPAHRVFVQGLVTNVLNPKVALFFLAFLPQFIDADAPSKVLAFLFLGLVFNVNGTLWNLLLAFASASLARRLRAGGRGTRWLERAAGMLFIGLGAKLALAER
jgi:RhtB (resistance to homoserine/threonine) family protein